MLARSASALVALFALAPLAAPQLSFGKAPRTVVGPVLPDRILVGTHSPASPNALAAGTAAEPVAEIEALGVHLLAFPPGTPDAVKLASLEKIAAKPLSDFAELETSASPPELASCGVPAAGAGGQSCTIAFFDGEPAPDKYDGQPAAALLNAASAAEYLLDRHTVVAVIDTGVDPGHPQLAGRLFSTGIDYLAGPGPALDHADGMDGDGDGLVDEAYGHGTHVAGLVLLMDPNALVLPMRVLDSDGNGSAFDVAQAIVDAVDLGAQVINLSLGLSGPSTAVELALAYAAEAGVPVFAAAGNTGGAVIYPASDANAHAVAALDLGDHKAVFSAYGPDVAVSAPGVELYGPMPGGQYAWWSGTSMATAVATGTASLATSIGTLPAGTTAPGLVASTALAVDAPNPGFEGALGSGRVDPLAAASAAAAAVYGEVVFLVLDEEAIGVGAGPTGFTSSEVNGGMADVALREPLPFFDGQVGAELVLAAGQVGDEGWFALPAVPAEWEAAESGGEGVLAYLQAGPGLGTPGGDFSAADLLDPVAGLVPLRATGLSALVGKRVRALVLDGDVSVNYGPLEANLAADHLGLVDVVVHSLEQPASGSSSDLPWVVVEVMDAAEELPAPVVGLFAEAPVPSSSSEPFDVDF